MGSMKNLQSGQRDHIIYQLVAGMQALQQEAASPMEVKPETEMNDAKPKAVELLHAGESGKYVIIQ